MKAPPIKPVTMRRYDYALNRLLPALLLYGWQCRTATAAPKVGDLVMLQSGPDSDWILSIYRQTGDGVGYSQRHLLESLKTGQVCWWVNVGFHVIDRDKAGIGPMLEWSDGHFEFADKLAKVHRRADFYLALPYIDRFDGDHAHLAFRTRFGFDDLLTELPPIAWRNITQRELLRVLREGEVRHKDRKPQ